MASEKDRSDDNTYHNKVRITKYNVQSIIIHVNQLYIIISKLRLAHPPPQLMDLQPHAII